MQGQLCRPVSHTTKNKLNTLGGGGAKTKCHFFQCFMLPNLIVDLAEN